MQKDSEPFFDFIARATIESLRDYLRAVYQQPWPDAADELLTLLQNMNLATDDGMLNLAGVLLFAERPEWIKPQFIVKAIRYPGNAIHVSEYLDTEDFVGPLPEMFEGAMAFVMRNLRKVQANQGVNAKNTEVSVTAVVEATPDDSTLTRLAGGTLDILSVPFGSWISSVAVGGQSSRLVLPSRGKLEKDFLAGLSKKLPVRGGKSPAKRAKKSG